MSWIKFNADQRGFFRVNYPLDSWLAFSKQLAENHEVLSAMDRASLINDAFALASAGLLDYSVAMSMLSYLKVERSLTPWKTAKNELVKLDDYLVDSQSYPLLKKVWMHSYNPGCINLLKKKLLDP